VLDEFGLYSYQGFKDIIHTARQANAAFIFSFQSIEQLSMDVSESFASDVASAPNTKFMMKISNEGTAKPFNRRLRAFRLNGSVCASRKAPFWTGARTPRREREQGRKLRHSCSGSSGEDSADCNDGAAAGQEYGRYREAHPCSSWNNSQLASLRNGYRTQDAKVDSLALDLRLIDAEAASTTVCPEEEKDECKYASVWRWPVLFW